jgi:Cu-processing system permease protein
MSTFLKIIKYQLRDLIRGKWLLLYTLIFFVLTDGLFRFGHDGSKIVLSLMNVVLFIVPLISIVFGSMFFYGSREFMELLLAQPISRLALFLGMFTGLAGPLSLAFVLGVGIPFTYNLAGFQTGQGAFGMLLLSGIALTLIFTALAYFIAVRNDVRVIGVGVTILVWLFFTIIYDGIMLAVIFIFQDYPLDNAVLAMSLFNPVDLARILLLLSMDISALLGYTGAVFKHYFGTPVGMTIALVSLTTWFMLPLWFGLRSFVKKDL